MQCRYCGCQLGDGVRFCDACGAPQILSYAVSDRSFEVSPGGTWRGVRASARPASVRNSWKIAALVMLCLAISTSLIAVYYYLLYQGLSGRTGGGTIHVNLGINYGDSKGTVWFNGTSATAGSTLLDATKRVATVAGTEYPGMGTFVTSINGVASSHPKYWIWWVWTSYEGWVSGPVACDRYVVADGETLLWYYEDTSLIPLPKPP